jgi:NAD(P)-dependent dehydrogenase (short-subunit alcohol dehydrogenase family)
MSRVAGKVVAVTGAGSGIGRALAVELATRGAKLAVSDVNADGLAATAADLRARGTEVHEQLLDVSDRAAVEAYAAAVAGHFGVVHQIYNNAGIAESATVLESDWADYDRVLGVNLWGVIHGTKAFLPHLVASGDGHVVNVSSLNGYMAQGEMTHYCTSKFGVRGFTEALRMELLAERVPVKVSVVHPGGVRTDIADAALRNAKARGREVTQADERRHRAYTEKLLRMDPAQAARIVVGGVEKGRARILVGRDAQVIDAVVRLLPERYVRLGAALVRRAG